MRGYESWFGFTRDERTTRHEPNAVGMETRSACIVILAAEKKDHFDRSRHRQEDWPLCIKMDTKGIGCEVADRIHWACDHQLDLGQLSDCECLKISSVS